MAREDESGHAHAEEAASVDPGTLLRGHGLRLTPTRQSVLGVLLRAARPMSRQEIVATLKEERPDAVTVYRALERLADAGLVHQTYLEDRHRRYEAAHRCREDRCHPHFTCRVCRRTSCMEDAVVPLVKNLAAGYVLERQKVLVEGLCPTCAVK